MTGRHDSQRSDKAVFCSDMPGKLLRMQTATNIKKEHSSPCFWKMIDTLMWQAALPIPSFEVTNTPINIPILVILFVGFPAGI
jgi:hypothetical protein